MKALVLEQVRSLRLKEMPDPRIQDPGDVIVRVTTAGICGSDLHIVSGRDAGIRPGTIMGHEFVGLVEEAGPEASFMKGDRVVSPFTINCGKCFYCIRQLPARCIHSLCFGFIDAAQGKGLEGAQAEYVRVPLAASTLLKVPAHLSDEEILFLGDIFSTAYSTAEKAEIQKGDVVVVIGCGPVGLLAVLAAKMFSPARILAIDSIDYRLSKASTMGAEVTAPDPLQVRRKLEDWTEGRGADAVIEAVGSPSALDLAIRCARPGAVVSIAGYHTATTYAFPIQLAYQKNLTVKIGRCNARKYMEKLLPEVEAKRIDLTIIITHTLPLNEAVRGYEIFAEKKEGAIKVLLKP